MLAEPDILILYEVTLSVDTKIENDDELLARHGVITSYIKTNMQASRYSVLT